MYVSTIIHPSLGSFDGSCKTTFKFIETSYVTTLVQFYSQYPSKPVPQAQVWVSAGSRCTRGFSLILTVSTAGY